MMSTKNKSSTQKTSGAGAASVASHAADRKRSKRSKTKSKAWFPSDVRWFMAPINYKIAIN